MAEIQQKEKGGGKKGQQKKKNVHIDFTPMVDMNMLLITFFMLCTSLSKPQTMEIAMPNKDKTEKPADVDDGNVNKKRAVTLLLDGNDKIYYYVEGDINTWEPTSYKPDGLRAYLLQRNKEVVKEIKELNKIKLETNMADTTYSRLTNLIKKEEIDAKGNAISKPIKTAPVVIIKASDKANYKNLIDALDEMQICNIGIYAILDIAKEDLELLAKINGEDTSPPANK